MKFNDVVIGVFFCVLGAGLAGYASTLEPPRHLQYGPGFFPGVIGAGLMLIGCLIVLLNVRTIRTTPIWVRPDWSYGLDGWMRFSSALIAIVFYLVAVNTLGFIATATIIVTFILLVSRIPIRRGLPVGLGTALVLTLVFASILRVPLPWGPLESISGWLIW
jgi:putative tricarboxylic transport membrane protein